MPTPLSLSLALQPPSSLHHSTPFSTHHSNHSNSSGLSIGNGNSSIGRRSGTGRSPIAEFASRTLRSPFSTPSNSTPASPTLRPVAHQHHSHAASSTPMAANSSHNSPSPHGLRRTAKRQTLNKDSDSHPPAAAPITAHSNASNSSNKHSPLSPSSSPSVPTVPSPSICLQQPAASTSTTTNVVITATTCSTTATANSTSSSSSIHPNANHSVSSIPTSSSSADPKATTSTQESATGVFWKALAHAKNNIALPSQAAIRLDTMTDYWHQFHLWHHEESPLADTEYDLDREHQRIAVQQHQYHHQQRQQQQLSCRPMAHQHHHPAQPPHSHHVPTTTKRNHHQPAMAPSPSPSSQRQQRSSSQAPRITMDNSSVAQQGRETLPRSTQDLSRLLESVFDETATAHAHMSHSRSPLYSNNNKNSSDCSSSDDDEDGPLCMRTSSTRLATMRGVVKTPSCGLSKSILKTTALPMSPKEKTLVQPPALPLSSLPRSSISATIPRPCSSHAPIAMAAPSVPALAPAAPPKVAAKPKFFVSDESDEDDDDDFVNDEVNEEDLLVANYRQLSQEIARGHQRRQQESLHHPSIDKTGDEGDDEREEDDDTATHGIAAMAPSSKKHYLTPISSNRPMVAERRQSLLSDLLMAEKMANIAAKKSAAAAAATAEPSLNECSMVNASPIPARVATFKQGTVNGNIYHNNKQHQHCEARVITHHESTPSSRYQSPANSDGESQLYPAVVVNGPTPESRKEVAMTTQQRGGWQHQEPFTVTTSSSSSGEEDKAHGSTTTPATRSPLMRTRRSLFKKLDELVKAAEAEKEKEEEEAHQHKALDEAAEHQQHLQSVNALMKDALEEHKDYFRPGAIAVQHQQVSDPTPLSQPQGQPQQQPEQASTSAGSGLGGWARSSVQYQIQSLYGMSASTVQRALSTATATLAEFGYLGSRGPSPSSTSPSAASQSAGQPMQQEAPTPRPQQHPQGRLSMAVNLLQKHLSNH